MTPLFDSLNSAARMIVKDEGKSCTKCKIWKPIDEFHRARNASGGRHCWCRTCHNAGTMARRDALRGGRPKQKKRPPHSLKPGTRVGRWTVIGLNRDGTRSGTYYDCICDCGTKRPVWSSNLLEKLSLSCGCLNREILRRRRKPADVKAITSILGSYRWNAKDRGLPFELTREDVAKLIGQPCYYCGVEGSNHAPSRSGEGFRYNGIDRVDSSRGYFLDNVVACCGDCNRRKSATPQAEFIAWAIRIAERHGSTK